MHTKHCSSPGVWQRYKVYKDPMQHSGQQQNLGGFNQSRVAALDRLVVWRCTPLPLIRCFHIEPRGMCRFLSGIYKCCSEAQDSCSPTVSGSVPKVCRTSPVKFWRWLEVSSTRGAVTAALLMNQQWKKDSNAASFCLVECELSEGQKNADISVGPAWRSSDHPLEFMKVINAAGVSG